MEQDYSTILAIPFSELNKSVNKIEGLGLIENPQHIGNHLYNCRIANKLLIKDVIEILNISRDTLTNWEQGLRTPCVSQYPLILKFLGYTPFNFDASIFSDCIKQYRYSTGLTCKSLANKIGVDVSILCKWESGKRVPDETLKEKILRILNNQ